MRLFFGLGLSANEALSLAGWREAHTHCDGRAVPPANFHITLAFLGECREERLDSLLQAADAVLHRSQGQAFEVTIDQVGYWSKPGIYWAGPSVWPQRLDALASNLRKLCGQFGARRERSRFQPHITLFRRCNRPPASPTEAPSIRIEAASVTLFESRQGRSGVSYHPLAEWD